MASSSSVHPLLQEAEQEENKRNVVVGQVVQGEGGAPAEHEAFARHDGDALHVLGGSVFPFSDAELHHCCCSADGCEACLTCGLCSLCVDQTNLGRSTMLRDWWFSMCLPQLAMFRALYKMDKRKGLGCLVCSVGLRAVGGQFLGCALEAGAAEGMARGVDFACNPEVAHLAGAATASFCTALCASTVTASEVNHWSRERTGMKDGSNCLKYCIGMHCFLPCFAFLSLRASRDFVPANAIAVQGAPKPCECEW